MPINQAVAILPQHRFRNAVAEHKFGALYAVDTPPAALVCSGPFRVKQAKGDDIVLERNPEYWVADKAGTRLPYFDSVRLLPDMRPGTELPIPHVGRFESGPDRVDLYDGLLHATLSPIDLRRQGVQPALDRI